MTGFWVLLQKEILEQRRTLRLPTLVGIFTALALLIGVIPFIVASAKGDERGPQQAQSVLEGFQLAATGLGTLLAIMIAMGTLANERSSGTAGMTLSKPVTTAAFVLTRFLGLALSILIPLAIASTIMYLMTWMLFTDVGWARFAGSQGIIGVYLIFTASIAFFWSSMVNRQLLAGGLTLLVWIPPTPPFNDIPHVSRYLPTNTPSWAFDVLGREATDKWPTFAVALGSVALFSTGAWAVFRGREL